MHQKHITLCNLYYAASPDFYRLASPAIWPRLLGQALTPVWPGSWCKGCSCEKKAEVKGWNAIQAWIFFFQAFFSQLRKYNNIIASITAMIFFHIILHPTVHIYDFHTFMYSNFNKNTLIQLNVPLMLHRCACTWSIKLSDYLSFNLVAFFSASLYGSNTNSRPIFKQSNIPLYQLGYL